MKKISIILPCAGSGERLGLNYPKELYEVYSGFKLIDFSLNHIIAFINNNPQVKIKIIVVITPAKTAVLDYVKDKIKNIKIIGVLFNNNYHEWAGSVYSASKYFEKNNIVLLPDSVIKLSSNSIYFDNNNKTLIEKMICNLCINKVVFAYKTCNDSEKLSKLGSIYFYEGKIYLFQDKPYDNMQNYNAFWTAYGFNKHYGKDLYCFLKESIQHNAQQYEKQSFYPSAGIETAGYYDLGTWESINSFLKEENKNDFHYNRDSSLNNLSK